MATIFTLTDTIRDYVARDGSKIYTVFVDGSFWGWVAGERRDFRAMGTNDYSWGPSRRTRAAAMEARGAQRADKRAKLVDQPMPAEVAVIRLTADNVAEVAPLLVGWMIDGAEDLGPIRNVRVTWDGYHNAKVVGERGSDVLGLPSTVTAYRV